MKEEVIEKLTEMYGILMEKPNMLFDIFKDFYGEEFVDMQGYLSLEQYISEVTSNTSEDYILLSSIPLLSDRFLSIFILVRFPEVRVTNENDKFIDIWELYAKVLFDWGGKFREFTLNRSEYNLFQLANNYMHSHVSSIPLNNLTSFQHPCLGSGPIRTTIATLADNFDELRWQLFCLEVSKYVQVESLSGGPYHRLENLGEKSMLQGERSWVLYSDVSLPHFNSFNNDRVKNFVKWLLDRKKLKFDYTNGSYGISMSYVNWRVFLSNEFIEWYNIQFSEGKITDTYNTLISEGVLQRGVINNNRFFYDRQFKGLNYSSFVGKKVCTFKGEEVVLKIRDLNDKDNTNNLSNFINSNLAEHIYKCILQVINYKYGNSNTETQTSGTRKEVIFL